MILVLVLISARMFLPHAGWLVEENIIIQGVYMENT